MNLKEYSTQLALGTVDFRQAANETQSSKVLQDIPGRTDDIAVLCAVATNPKTNIYTLTLLATFPQADMGIVISCAHHPNITLNVLERWMKYPTIAGVQAVQQRVRSLQLALGVAEKDAQVVEDNTDPLPDDPFAGMWRRKLADAAGTEYPTIPLYPKDYVIWTTTGNNHTLEIDDGRFNFTGDPDTVYYSCDNSNGIPVPLKMSE